MSRNVYILNGTSGVGKGTRVLQFMMFLENHLSLKPKLLVMNVEKERVIGRHYPDLDFTVVGKFCLNRVTKKINWSGWDSIAHNNSIYCRLDIFGQDMNVLYPDLVRNFLRGWGGLWTIEGYPKVAPTAYSLWDSFDKIYDTYYLYNDIANEVEERCRTRTGSGQSLKASVDMQGLIIKNIFTQVDRARERNRDMNLSGYFREKLSASSPLYSWGNIFLDSLGMSGLKPLFEKFCEENQYHRRYDTGNVLDIEDKFNQQSTMDKIVIDYRDLVRDGATFRTKEDKRDRAIWKLVKNGKLETIDLNLFGFGRDELLNLIQWKKDLKERGIVYEDGEYYNIEEGR